VVEQELKVMIKDSVTEIGKILSSLPEKFLRNRSGPVTAVTNIINHLQNARNVLINTEASCTFGNVTLSDSSTTVVNMDGANLQESLGEIREFIRTIECDPLSHLGKILPPEQLHKIEKLLDGTVAKMDQVRKMTNRKSKSTFNLQSESSTKHHFEENSLTDDKKVKNLNFFL